MTQLKFNDRQFTMQEGETVLDCLLRHDQPLAHSCKSGVCQACLVQAVDCEVPAKAQQNLGANLCATGHGLACQWVPASDTTVQPSGSERAAIDATISEITLLNPQVWRLRLTLAAPDALDCRPGQYVNLATPTGIVRSYSVANDPRVDGFIEFHIARAQYGQFTGWLAEQAHLGDTLQIRGPIGTCFYGDDTDRDATLMLAGLGTGLAPLYGIVHDALRRGHRGQIVLLHGAGRTTPLYNSDALSELADRHANFRYQPDAEVPAAETGISAVEAQAVAALPTADALKATRVFLCGNPGFVQRLRKQCFLRGVPSSQIHCDPFIERSVTATP